MRVSKIVFTIVRSTTGAKYIPQKDRIDIYNSLRRYNRVNKLGTKKRRKYKYEQSSKKLPADNNDPHRLKYPAKLQDNINTNTLTPTRASNMSYKSCISKPSKSSNTNQYTTQKGYHKCRDCSVVYKYQGALLNHEKQCVKAQINCVCLKNVEKGTMVQCDSCLNWLHITCIKQKKSTLPVTYYCPHCLVNDPSVKYTSNNDGSKTYEPCCIPEIGQVLDNSGKNDNQYNDHGSVNVHETTCHNYEHIAYSYMDNIFFAEQCNTNATANSTTHSNDNNAETTYYRYLTMLTEFQQLDINDEVVDKGGEAIKECYYCSSYVGDKAADIMNNYCEHTTIWNGDNMMSTIPNNNEQDIFKSLINYEESL